MQAIILAAGMGKRLKELTQGNTKCMVNVCGTTLIERALRQLDRKNLSRIVIVTGYKGDVLVDFIDTLRIKTRIEYIDNPVYYKTNNIYSLSLAKKQLTEDDTLLLESDIIFEEDVLDSLIEDPRGSLALVDKYEPWMDGTCIKINSKDEIEDFISGKKFDFTDTTAYFKTVNIYKFSKEFSAKTYVPFLDAYTSALGENEYYEQVLKVITVLENPGIMAKRLSGQKWYEIDDAADLDIASSLFSDDEEKLTMMQQRFGGYWRYPKLLDFCYLVNPFFPPQKMKEEIIASFNQLLTQYPSGMSVNSLLAAKIFGISRDCIVVGNGAAELIKSLMSSLDGKVGFILPTFQEYLNRLPEDRRVIMNVSNKDFSYSGDDIIDFFTGKDISTLILINPDNPSGNYIKKNDVLKLVDWTKKNGINLVYDESFGDFASEEDNSLIDSKILSENSHLFVVKSISKSYGVPGIRLGILASGNTAAISSMKKDVAIWNINSFGEFFLQIYEKYSKAYTSSLKDLSKERTRFEKELKRIDGVRPIHSEANYITAELTNGLTSRSVTKKLLCADDILIKDLYPKVGGQYIRLAVRNKPDDDRLLSALRAAVKEA